MTAPTPDQTHDQAVSLFVILSAMGIVLAGGHVSVLTIAVVALAGYWLGESRREVLA
jgi:hypothetical protein